MMTPTEINSLRQRIIDAVDGGRVKQVDLARGSEIDPAQLSRFLKRGAGISDAQLVLLRITLEVLDEAPDPLDPKVAIRLASLLRDGKLILFAGAGLSMQCPPVHPGNEGFPSWSELVKTIADEFIAEEVDAEDFRDTPTLFFDYVRDLDGGEAKLKAAFREALDSNRVLLSGAHHALAKLPWAEVWTTNYDDMLERALGAKLVNGNADHELISQYKRSRSPFVLHLLGTVADPHTLGKRSYELWEQSNPKLIAYVRSVLLDGHTALFVGYGLSDPNLDAVFGWLRNVTANKLRLHGFLHDVAPGVLRAYERSINLHAVSFSTNAEYVAAFRQIERELRRLTGELAQTDASAALTVEAVASNDAYERTQLATAMQRRWNDSGVAGLYLTDAKYRADDLGVDDVFVEPGVSNWSPVAVSYGVTDVEMDQEEFDAGYEGREPRNLHALRRARRPVAPPAAEPAIAALAAQRLTVLLGDPGSGKSLLLRNIARSAAAAWQNTSPTEPSPLPVYLRLNAWESHSSANAPDAALLAVVRDELLTYADVPREQIQQWTSSDRPILWLLDGLDEVRSEAARDGVREAVATLARTRPQDRFIVSARPSGYRTRFDGQWRELALQPLNDAQQTAVFERWRKITADRDNLTLDVPGLVKDLKASRALSDLRGNPLMLTLAILFYRIKRRLPRDRWEYYEIVDTNLRDQLARQRALREQPVERERRAWPDILGRIALSGMRAGLPEDGRGKVRFSRDEIETIVVDYHRAQQCTVREALAEAERFLRAADDLLGVIVAFAPDEYGFLHLTFQEYHAARRLLQMNLPDEKVERERLMADAWDHPDWKEVWQLVVLGSVDTGHVDVFEALCDAAHHNGWPELDEWLARSELQQLEWVGLVGARVFNTATWARLESWVVQQFFHGKRHQPNVAHVLQDWSRPLSASLQAFLLAILCDPNADDYARCYAAQATGSTAAPPVVAAALLSILRDPVTDDFVRHRVSRTLSGIAARPEVMEALLAILCAPEANDLGRCYAAQALGSVATAPNVRDALLAFLRDRKVDRYVRGAAAQALGNATDAPTVTDSLLAIVHDQKVHGYVRNQAALALCGATTAPEVIEALLARLRDRRAGADVRVRSQIARALSNLAVVPEVQEVLLARVRDQTDNVDVRSHAAQALGSASATPEVAEALLALICHPKEADSVRGGAALALCRVAATSAVTDALLAVLREPKADGSVRSDAARALGNIADTPTISQALFAFLHDSKMDSFARRSAAQALGSVADTPAVTGVLLAILHDPTVHRFVRGGTAEALSGVAFRLRR